MEITVRNEVPAGICPHEMHAFLLLLILTVISRRTIFSGISCYKNRLTLRNTCNEKGSPRFPWE
jgi:hypothetical protein